MKYQKHISKYQKYQKGCSSEGFCWEQLADLLREKNVIKHLYADMCSDDLIQNHSIRFQFKTQHFLREGSTGVKTRCKLTGTVY